MQRIQRLTAEVVNKIAAGEVVERPASVVKELVENAVDAGAARIVVELESGGCKRITVSDDGGGISPADCELVLECHATSKIDAAEDLFAIDTLGFRGEALSAISAVSRFSLFSQRPEDKEGLAVSHSDGKTTTRPWRGALGTTVNVEDLFANIPARRKFLKTSETEYAHCSEWLQALALSQPQLGLVLSHNGKEKANWPACSDAKPQGPFGEGLMRSRVAAVLGAQVAAELMYCKQNNRYGLWEGLISPPGLDKPSSRRILNFVNGRWVKDRILLHGILRGYHSHLLKGRYPIVVAFLQSDPSLIDVNAHPAKTELRFQYGAEVQSLIAEGIRGKLRAAEWAEEPGVGLETSSAAPPATKQLRPSAYVPPARVTTQSFGKAPRSTTGKASSLLSSKGSGAASELSEPGVASEQALPLAGPAEPPSSSSPQLRPPPWQELAYLGSLADCYLMFQSGEGLLLIDQHAFHERILYERLISNSELWAQSQRLMIVEAIELRDDQVVAFRDNKPVLERLGFSAKLINASTIEIAAVPTLLADKDIAFVLEAILERCLREEPATGEHVYHEILSTLACHAAVRSGDTLGEIELKALLQEAKGVDFFHNCPHGRRVLRWLSRDKIASLFDR